MIFVELSTPISLMAGGVEEGRDTKERAIFRDIRRYYCDYCGICRSKKYLIRSHMLSHHKDEIQNAQAGESNAEKEANEQVPHVCQDCGASFRKPAYLKQHMQSHSLEGLGFLNDEIGVKYLDIYNA